MFSKKNWINASPKNNHYFLKLYTLEEFAICAMSTSQYKANFNPLKLESVSIVNQKDSYIYPQIYVIKDKMASVFGRPARDNEICIILDHFAVNFYYLCVTYIENDGAFKPLVRNDEDSQFIITLMKNALIKGGYL